MRAGRHRLGENRAVHVGMPARFEHQRAAEMIRMPAHPLALLEHRRTARRRKALDDEPQRFAGGVRIDRFHAYHLVIKYLVIGLSGYWVIWLLGYLVIWLLIDGL